jgi:hypothetical protein
MGDVVGTGFVISSVLLKLDVVIRTCTSLSWPFEHQDGDGDYLVVDIRLRGRPETCKRWRINVDTFEKSVE